ncbi:LysR family transcriptional regulator [Marinomonas pollencensis]|uniref:LysR family transcriptional regulator n=2 Tax=Marinomonas pollencensis TaxID=491954 RepID=A0A3E0DPE2_9GAMM|nr:LysR family transcriptional regulator [Marinomonas pollencensis]
MVATAKVKLIYVKRMKKIKSGGIDRIEMMQTFVRIVESGSLSAAALQLNTTQPTVSRRLKSLEARLGAKLIMRTTHAMKLTDDGERCYQHAKQLIASWDALEEDLINANDEPVGTLKVRAPHAFGQDQLIAPLVRYLAEHGQISVEWMLNDHSPDFINDGIDCAIRVGEITDSSMVAILLAEVPRIVVASPALLADYPDVKTVDELARLPWVALSTFYRNKVTLKCAAQGINRDLEFTPRFVTDSLYALRNTVLSGVGVGVSSAWMVNDDLASGELVQLLPEWRADPLPVYLVYPYASYYPARLRKFFELIREVMPTLVGARPPSPRA